MAKFHFRDDGVYHAHVNAQSETGSDAHALYFLCFVYTQGCIAAQWERVSAPLEIDAEIMHELFLWHHDAKKSNVSHKALATLTSGEASMISAEIEAPKPLSLRLIPINERLLSVVIVAPWRSEKATPVGFTQYTTVLH
jgi:hypothetical protein